MTIIKEEPGDYLHVGLSTNDDDDDEAKTNAEDSLSNEMTSPGPSKARTFSENSTESKLMIDDPSSGSGIRYRFQILTRKVFETILPSVGFSIRQ